MNASPAFMIRNGVLYAPVWEWDSTQATILGFRYEAYLPRCDDDGTWATLFFPNGWNINWAWGLWERERCISVWEHVRDDLYYKPKLMRHDATPDDVLRHVADIASREPLVPGPARQGRRRRTDGK